MPGCARAVRVSHASSWRESSATPRAYPVATSGRPRLVSGAALRSDAPQPESIGSEHAVPSSHPEEENAPTTRDGTTGIDRRNRNGGRDERASDHRELRAEGREK